MVIEVNKNARHRIKATSTAPGTAKDQYTYMSEITELYNVVSIIEIIYEKQNIRRKRHGHQYYIFVLVKLI